MMDRMSVKRKNIRQKSTGSLKIQIPTITVPTAPIPVQTAYAVPSGSVLVAVINKNMLIARQTKKPSNQMYDSFPLVSRDLPKHVAKPTSNNPAMINKNQDILFFYGKIHIFYAIKP